MSKISHTNTLWEAFPSLLNPQCSNSPEASVIHGLTDDDIRNAHSFADPYIVNNVLEFLYVSMVVAHIVLTLIDLCSQPSYTGLVKSNIGVYAWIP